MQNYLTRKECEVATVYAGMSSIRIRDQLLQLGCSDLTQATLCYEVDLNNGGRIVEQILTNLVTGAIGGNAAGKASSTFDLGTLGNTIAGLVGGGALGQIITLVWPALSTSLQGGNFDIGSIVAQVIGGGAGGAILTAIVGAIKNKAT